MSEESMPFDVIIVGAGPAGLSAAIRLKQLKPELVVCVLEKAAQLGGHSLSGAVLEPRALDRLIPNWRDDSNLNPTLVTQDKFYLLTHYKSWSLPIPPPLQNSDNVIISLSLFCRWLGQQAENLGVEIYPGFSGREVLIENNRVIGIKTTESGRLEDGSQGPNYQPGMNLMAEHILLAEGCRGSLSEQVIELFNLRQSPQTYGIGLKELWRVDPKVHQPGLVTHTIGWPLDNKTYGGGFVYHWGDNLVSLGLIIGLDYQNTYLNPFQELQQLKTHPQFINLFKHGERLEYGARALNEGGWQGLPQMVFPGGMLIGCAAGTLNTAKIKGNHTAMQSGILAAESIINKTNYDTVFKQSWVATELKAARNIRPGFYWGLWPGLIYAALETYLLRGKAPWTFKLHSDHTQLTCGDKINYPRPDGKITFDLLSSVYLSNVHHTKDQPGHLILKNPDLMIEDNYKNLASPEIRYCPAGVYEIRTDESGNPLLQINVQNCLHCKTCDIKDPNQNIQWITPESGGGPNYQQM